MISLINCIVFYLLQKRLIFSKFHSMIYATLLRFYSYYPHFHSLFYFTTNTMLHEYVLFASIPHILKMKLDNIYTV